MTKSKPQEQTSAARFKDFAKSNSLLIIVAVAVIAISSVGAYMLSTMNQSSSQQANVQQTDCDVAACIPLVRGESEQQVHTVESGSFVQFNSADGQKHHLSLVHSGVQHEDESRYESGDFEADEAWRVEFKEDGTYTFADKYNDNALISVIVYTAGKDYDVGSVKANPNDAH